MQADFSVEGRNLDSLNIANLRRRQNRSLTVQRAYHLAKIEGEALSVAWKYDGFCRGEKESQIEFSVDSEHNVPFKHLDCYAFDLQEDSDRRHPIRPILLGADGLSKKLAVPFLAPLAHQQPFSVMLHCTLPDYVGEGLHYYTSTLSFDQAKVPHLAVHLVFVRHAPPWVRVYESNSRSTLQLIRQIQPFKDDGETCEYLDLCESASGRHARVYVFELTRIPKSRILQSEPSLLDS